MTKKNLSIVIILLFLITGCWDSGGSGGNSNDTGASAGSAGGAGDAGQSADLNQVSNAEWEDLSSEEQYAVSNKLLGTLYKGLPAEEFFNFTPGNDSPSAKSKSNT